MQNPQHAQGFALYWTLPSASDTHNLASVYSSYFQQERQLTTLADDFQETL